VGFFRTHVRPGLFLDEHDFRTVQEFFADPNQVVLLVRPEPAGSLVAGFFFWEAGDMERSKSYRPFPLDDAAVPVSETGPSAVKMPLPETPGAPVPLETSNQVPAVRTEAVAPIAPGTPARRAENDGGWRYGLVAACIPFVAGLAYYAGRHEAPRAHAAAQPSYVSQNSPVAPIPTPSPAAATPAPAENQNQPENVSPAPAVARFPMAAKKSPMDTPSSLAASRARRAREEEEPDWAATLPSRSNTPASYRPGSYQTGQGIHGGVRVVNSRSDQPAPSSQPTSAAPEQTTPTETVRLESRTAEMRPEPEPTAPAPMPERTVQRFRPELHPAITVEAEDPSSGLGRRLVRLPKRILTLGRAGRDDFIPPRPLREVAPSVPPRIAQQLTDVVPITVRITVDSDGRVRGTELVTGAADPQLADLALNAARKWEFVAARQNNTPVPSSVVAHFRFRPPQP